MKDITEKNNNLDTAHKFIKIAKDYAKYKRTEGYNENDFSMFEVVNLDASLEICNRGPADYYYEKAYDMLCSKYGKEHPEVRKLVKEIVNYHVNNVKRMLTERYCFIGIILAPIIYIMTDKLYPKGWPCLIATLSCYVAYIIYWHIDQAIMCYMEKRHYRKLFR